MIKKTVAIALSIFIGVSTIKAQDSDGKDGSTTAIRTAVPFLTIAPDSRAGAMGDAGVATKPDINSQYWNSSKYMLAEEKAGVSISYTPWLKSLGVTDLNLLYLAGYYQIDKKQTVSGGLRYFNMGSIEAVDNVGNTTGDKINPHEFAVDAGYSRAFSEYLSGGLLFRFIYSNIASGFSDAGIGGGAVYEPGTSVAADINAFYQRPTKVSGYDAEWALGLNFSNIGNKMNYSEDNDKQFIPANMRLGGRFDLEIDDYNSISATLDLNKLLVPLYDSTNMSSIQAVLKSFSDAPGGFSEEMQEIMYSFGLEYWYMKQFAVRAGYFHENEYKGNRKYFTAGVGLRWNVLELDFSYLIPAQGGRNNPLANTMRLSLGFIFE